MQQRSISKTLVSYHTQVRSIYCSEQIRRWEVFELSNAWFYYGRLLQCDILISLFMLCSPSNGRSTQSRYFSYCCCCSAEKRRHFGGVVNIFLRRFIKWNIRQLIFFFATVAIVVIYINIMNVVKVDIVNSIRIAVVSVFPVFPAWSSESGWPHHDPIFLSFASFS